MRPRLYHENESPRWAGKWYYYGTSTSKLNRGGSEKKNFSDFGPSELRFWHIKENNCRITGFQGFALVDTATAKAKQYPECNTLVTRIEVRIMRLRREKGDRKQGALQTTQDPNVPNNNTGIILSIIPVLILGIIYISSSSSIENTASIIYYCTFAILML